MTPLRTLLAVLLLGAAISAPTAASAAARSALGLKTHSAKSSKGMKLKITPGTAVAGSTFRASAGKLRSGEYVTVWQYRGKQASQLVGGRASRKGKVKISIKTTEDATVAGKYKVCLQGERSRRIACGTYVVKEPPLAEDEDDSLDNELDEEVLEDDATGERGEDAAWMAGDDGDVSSEDG